LAAEGLPVHAYHAVIQQLKQQKHELTAQQLAERRKAKASDTLSSTILSNLSCGVLFLNTSGLVRQANAAARKLLGFASPVGLDASDLFRTATLRPDNDISSSGSSSGSGSAASVEQALAPALAGKSAVRGLVVNYFARDGESHVLEVTASPVLAEDASLMGTTLVLTDKTDIERIRHDQKMHQEISSELALGLRDSLTTIAGYAQQLACSRDAELAHQLADSIAHEAAQLDRTIGSFLGGTRAAATSSRY
jgi:PAS domain-containing protein